jgi:hypothetical protein
MVNGQPCDLANCEAALIKLRLDTMTESNGYPEAWPSVWYNATFRLWFAEYHAHETTYGPASDRRLSEALRIVSELERQDARPPTGG